VLATRAGVAIATHGGWNHWGLWFAFEEVKHHISLSDASIIHQIARKTTTK
jgi:hypothetical protein